MEELKGSSYRPPNPSSTQYWCYHYPFHIPWYFHPLRWRTTFQRTDKWITYLVPRWGGSLFQSRVCQSHTEIEGFPKTSAVLPPFFFLSAWGWEDLKALALWKMALDIHPTGSCSFSQLWNSSCFWVCFWKVAVWREGKSTYSLWWTFPVQGILWSSWNGCFLLFKIFLIS